MNDPFKVLRWLSKAFAVLAWVAIVWTVVALFTAQISDEQHFDGALLITDKAGVGLMGALGIIVDGVMRFLVLLGASQAIKLWLGLDAATSATAGRVADIVVALQEVKGQQQAASEQLRLVGSIVYEESKKDG